MIELADQVKAFRVTYNAVRPGEAPYFAPARAATTTRPHEPDLCEPESIQMLKTAQPGC